MSAPAPDWMAAVMRGCRSLALMVSSVTSAPSALDASGICRFSSTSDSGMKSTQRTQWSLVPCAKAGARRAARMPSMPPIAAAATPAVLMNVRRSSCESVVSLVSGFVMSEWSSLTGSTGGTGLSFRGGSRRACFPHRGRSPGREAGTSRTSSLRCESSGEIGPKWWPILNKEPWACQRETGGNGRSAPIAGLAGASGTGGPQCHPQNNRHQCHPQDPEGRCRHRVTRLGRPVMRSAPGPARAPGRAAASASTMPTASVTHPAPKPPRRSTTSPNTGGHTATPSEEIARPSPTAVPAARGPASSAMRVCCTPFQPTPKNADAHRERREQPGPRARRGGRQGEGAADRSQARDGQHDAAAATEEPVGEQPEPDTPDRAADLGGHQVLGGHHEGDVHDVAEVEDEEGQEDGLHAREDEGAHADQPQIAIGHDGPEARGRRGGSLRLRLRQVPVERPGQDGERARPPRPRTPPRPAIRRRAPPEA